MKTIITHPGFDYMKEELLKDSEIQVCDRQWEYFDDGEPNFRINEQNGEIEYQDVTYIGDFSKTSKFFENYAAIRAILDGIPNKVRVIVPYFPVGTMERAEKKGEAVTAKYFADLISSLPSGRDMKTSIHHLDLHNPVIKHYYDASKVNPELHTAMSLIKEKITAETNIIFPDEGAYKRFRRYFEGYNLIICEKRKENGIKTVRVKEGEAIGDHGIVIDDLGLSGGTLMKCGDATRAIGIKTCDAYVTHGSFPGESHEEIANIFDTLYTTDSIPKNIDRAKNISNMEVLRIATLIQKIISK
ncbi:ribose-phosphate pyrophosphokinase-like domain-containing protein [Candidatus Gracilibacteria bacterium]|nr:ribose-phosphate pyrophosphokinase-like domain-containing protein [Candidatus Gracilibacteria bacterium]